MRCNAVTFTCSDGKVQTFDLDDLIGRGAVLASKVGGEDILSTMGAFNQLWIPGLPAKYYVRDIVRIDFSSVDEPPKIAPFLSDGRDYTNLPNVSVKAPYSGAVGKKMRFEGYAQDFDRSIVAVELSFDGGASWLVCTIADAASDKWVWWTFDWIPQNAGSHQVLVRARSDDGTASPISASHVFEVEYQ